MDAQKRAQKEQLLQALQRVQPSLQLSTNVNSNQLFQILNQLSMTPPNNLPYDDQTFEELIERVQDHYGSLTIGNFLDVHLQAANILSFRIEQSKANRNSLQDFVQKLGVCIGELNRNEFAQPQTDQSFAVDFKSFNFIGQVNSNNLQLRIINEAMNIDQTLAFMNKSIQLNNQSAAIDNLLQNFQLEVYDTERNYGFATLNVYQLSLRNPQKVQLPLSVDSMDSGFILEVVGNVTVSNASYAQEDQVQLQQAFGQLSEEIIGLEEQYQGINSPFSNQPQPSSYNQQFAPQTHQRNQSLLNQSHQSGQHNSYRPQQEIPVAAAFSQQQQNQNFNNNDQFQQQPYQQDPAYLKPVSSHRRDQDEDCDLSSQSLVKNLHTIVIIYLVVAALFCVKRSMFMDVSISIAFLAVLYKINLITDQRAPIILKLFAFFFVFSAVMDLMWLIVYFPGWNRNETSEDQGAQNVIRMIILGGSLLFMVYKILTIVAVIYLQSSAAQSGPQVKIELDKFLNGDQEHPAAYQQRPSQNGY